MKTGFSTNAFVKKSLNFAINSVAKTGFDGIEIVLDVPHAFLPITKTRIGNIKNKIKQNQLKITNLNANTVVGWYKNKLNIEKFEPSLSNQNEKMRKWRIKNIQQSIDLAEELDAPSICITSGLGGNSTKKESLARFRDSLDIILPYAEKKGVLIGIEYEPGLLIEKFNDVKPFISNEYKNLGVNFDVCHAAVLGENIPKIIKKLGPKLFHTHISDCKNKIHYHLIPGIGEINFKTMYKALLDINYKGFLTAELYPYSTNPEKAAKETIMYFNKLMK
ncbi:MAG: sugar phosphate isomerase/epimerase [Nitrosopumilus sp.]|nr:sugar phosphate isomerase/epimerase [Nitrosopumilus sp.]